MANNTLLELQNIAVGYDEKRVLQKVNLTIAERDYLGIIGPNGGGKTTLVKLILKLLAPQEGTIRYFKNGKEEKNIQIGYLPQYNAFDKKFPISVREIVLSGLNCRKSLFSRFSTTHHQQVDHVLSQLELTELAQKAIGTLSGGQRQRVFLGRALVSDPDLLILDEPNTYIDRHSEQKLYRILEEVNHRCAIVLVSHDVGTVMRNVRNIACVDGTLNYHAGMEEGETWIEKQLGCPFELLAHGHVPHRVLAEHPASDKNNPLL
ncbi:MAG: ABC transporter ATP-binding protein [Bacteroidaceae bacterium]